MFSDSQIETPLVIAVQRGLGQGGNLGDSLGSLGEYSLSTINDANALIAGIEEWLRDTPQQGIDLILPLHLFTGLLQGVATLEAYERLRRFAVPNLLKAFDRALAAEPLEGVETLLFVLKVAGMYTVEDSVERVATASSRGLGMLSPLWPAIFATFNDEHPFQIRLAQRLKHDLPKGMIGLSYLHFTGELLRSSRLTFQPFDTNEGRSQLREWLSSTSSEAEAMIVAANIPYLEPENREAFLQLARRHPSGGVRLKGLWAEAKLGDEAALKKLVEACRSPGRAKVASEALNDLGRGALIPATSREPTFVAASDLCAWLAHPNEYGRPPDALELYDTRLAYWPPTQDHRRLWLFRFRYVTEGSKREGFGMTGSITFSLRDETRDLTSAIDLYALHCLWELQTQDDPRNPRERSLEQGRRLLAEAGWVMTNDRAKSN